MCRANMDTLTERSANTLRPTRVQISKTTPEPSRVLISSHALHTDASEPDCTCHNYFPFLHVCSLSHLYTAQQIPRQADEEKERHGFGWRGGGGEKPGRKPRAERAPPLMKRQIPGTQPTIKRPGGDKK